GFHRKAQACLVRVLRFWNLVSLSLITLGVADVSRSRAFYEALGFKASAASQDGVAFFKVGSCVLSLYGRGALAEDAGVPPRGMGFVVLRWRTTAGARTRSIVSSTRR
ncbi:MAG: VOC family protein, partial [Hyphomicrobiaceae bacterium]